MDLACIIVFIKYIVLVPKFCWNAKAHHTCHVGVCIW